MMFTSLSLRRKRKGNRMVIDEILKEGGLRKE